MNIHEYQAKQLLRNFGVEVLPGFVAYTAQEVRDKIASLPGDSWIVKAQIHSGGRGKAGGVKFAKSIQEAEAVTQKMIGARLVTEQTGSVGKIVHKVYVEEACALEQEFYLAFYIDGRARQVCLMVGRVGGVNIEDVVTQNPQSLLKVPIDPLMGLWPYQTRRVAHFLGLSSEATQNLHRMLPCLYQAFLSLDFHMLEINPLIVTKDQRLIPLDAKVIIDDNALMRHPQLEELRDVKEESDAEVESARLGLSYIKLNGNIGCVVNGAGLAMATLDLIQQQGARAANFLDVGGGASRDKITAAFRFIVSDPHVEGILVNIFGGIMRCDVFAEGIVQALQSIKANIPVVVRLEGTNAEEGGRILRQANLDIYPTTSLNQAAQKIVGLVQNGAA